MLGRQFDELGYAPADYVEEFRVWQANEGMQPDWTVELRDGSMDFLLTESRKVKTVFVHSVAAISSLVGIDADKASVADVIAKFGSATRGGEETKIPVLGKKGAWLRYDKPNEVVHLEFRLGGTGIHMLTLMTPSDAPADGETSA